jgi:protein gp37
LLDSLIGWTHDTWNPWRGCSGESCWLAAMGLCYAENQESRYGRDFLTATRTTTAYWKIPFQLNAEAAQAGHAKRVFCGSLMDFNDRQVSTWRDKAWAIIKDMEHLCWMLLSKCPERYADNLPDDWRDGYANVWLGASVLHAEDFRRNTRALRAVPAVRRFLSMEPLLGSIPEPDFRGIDLILVGGLSGPQWKEHKMQMSWVLDLYHATRSWNETHRDRPVHFFFKQDSHRFTERGIDGLGKALGLPEDSQVIREMPTAPFGLPWAPVAQKGDRS